MKTSGTGRIPVIRHIGEKDGGMVVELHFPAAEKKSPSPVEGDRAEIPMLMLWNGEMEVGPLSLPSFRRGIAWGSLTGITHVRVLPSVEWTEIGRFSGPGLCPAVLASSSPLSQAEASKRGEAGEGDYFYPPLSPYGWLRGLAIGWAFLSLLGFLLPSSLQILAVVSVLGAVGVGIGSVFANRRPGDLCFPVLCALALLVWMYAESGKEPPAGGDRPGIPMVMAEAEPEKVTEKKQEQLPELPAPPVPAKEEAAEDVPAKAPSLADLPGLEQLPLP